MSSHKISVSASCIPTGKSISLPIPKIDPLKLKLHKAEEMGTVAPISKPTVPAARLEAETGESQNLELSEVAWQEERGAGASVLSMAEGGVVL